MDDDALPFDGRFLSPRFALVAVTIPPGARRPYDADEWRDTLVLVQAGEIELECTRGGHRRFGPGALLPLGSLSLRALYNPGLEPVRLTAVSRTMRAER